MLYHYYFQPLWHFEVDLLHRLRIFDIPLKFARQKIPRHSNHWAISLLLPWHEQVWALWLRWSAHGFCNHWPTCRGAVVGMYLPEISPHFAGLQHAFGSHSFNHQLPIVSKNQTAYRKLPVSSQIWQPSNSKISWNIWCIFTFFPLMKTPWVSFCFINCAMSHRW